MTNDDLLNLAWRMFASLGTPASAAPIESAPVDPEATLLLGAILGTRDTRILEMTAWLLHTSHAALSITRTKKIARDWEKHGTHATASVARIANSIPELHQWRKAFPSKDTTFVYDDRLISRIGATKPSNTVQQTAGAFRIRMRLAFGTGARTEALSALITHTTYDIQQHPSWTTLSELEHLTGFGRRYLSTCLAEMTQAGIVDQKRSGKTLHYRITPEAVRWPEPIPHTWIDWPEFLTVLLTLDTVISESPNLASVTDTLDDLARYRGYLPQPFQHTGDPATTPAHFQAWAAKTNASLVSIR